MGVMGCLVHLAHSLLKAHAAHGAVLRLGVGQDQGVMARQMAGAGQAFAVGVVNLAEAEMLLPGWLYRSREGRRSR